MSTVSNAATALVADHEGFSNTVAEIAAGYDQFEQFVTGLFDELDALSADFAQRYNAWQEQCQTGGKETEALRGQLRLLERQKAAWDRDRTALEDELEAVRNQAAELAEALAEQKRQMEIQQTEWSRELRQMRRLLEMMARRQLEQHEEQESRQALPPAAAVSIVPATVDDPVLDSVMAQFEMLQKDISRRRRHA